MQVFTGTQPKRSLTLHLRTHSDEPSKQKERKFKCDHCGKVLNNIILPFFLRLEEYLFVFSY